MDVIRFLSFYQGWAIPFFGLFFIDGPVERAQGRKSYRCSPSPFIFTFSHWSTT